MAQKSLLTNHELNRTAEMLESRLGDVKLIENLNLLNTEQRAAILRGKAFVKQLRQQIDASNDSDVIFSLLGSIQAGLQNAINEFNAFIQNANPGHIDNYSSHLDGAIVQANNAFYFNRLRGDRRYGESVQGVENAAIEAIGQIRESQNALLARIEEANALVASQTEAVNAVSVRIDSKIKEGSETFRGFAEKFQELSAEQRKEIREFLELQQSNFLKNIEELAQSGSNEIAKLKTLEASAKSIVHIIGNVGVTGNYQNRAGSEQDQANSWRLFTILLFLVGIVMVIINLVMNFKGDIGLDLLLVRFGIAISISLPAIYTARESARHRSNADRAKQTELELASLGPYLETLPSEAKEKVIVELSKLYFGREIADHKIDYPVDVSKLVDTISKIALSKV